MIDEHQSEEVDPRSGSDVMSWLRSEWPSARIELSDGGETSYLIHIWRSGKCVAFERRHDLWGMTPDLAADPGGFNSGHPYVFRQGSVALSQLAKVLHELG